MSKSKELITDEMIDNAWGNANFGNVSKRDVIFDSLLKCVSGYQTGHTAKCIVTELGLVTSKWALTKLGKAYFYEASLKHIQQEAIAFAEWMFDEINPFMKHEGKWVQACGNSTSWTTSQLYNLFKQKQ